MVSLPNFILIDLLYRKEHLMGGMAEWSKRPTQVPTLLDFGTSSNPSTSRCSSTSLSHLDCVATVM